MLPNVLFIHLEGISRANLWQYRNELSAIWDMLSLSLHLPRFFTASTSTIMTVDDVLYGDSSVNDPSPLHRGIAGKYNIYSYPPIIDDFMRQGYRCLTFGTSPHSNPCTFDSHGYIYENNPGVLTSCDFALKFMEESEQDNLPFFVYFLDDFSYRDVPFPARENREIIPEGLGVGYALVNTFFSRLLDGIKERSLLQNTIIVTFGVHSDAPWGRCLNRDYGHRLAPHAGLCWTPAFIYWPERLGHGVDDRLVSSIDLKETILGMLRPERNHATNPGPFSGVDVFQQNRDVAYSQNMYALQREYSDPEQSMIKGYSVTDGNYRLVVSSGGRHSERGGMSLYCDQSDPTNSFNLLKFFALDDAGDIREFHSPPDAVGLHFQNTFGADQVESIAVAFSRLKRRLRRFIEEKEEYAGAEYERLTTASVDDLVQHHCAGKNTSSEAVRKSFENVQKQLRENPPDFFPAYAFRQISGNQL